MFYGGNVCVPVLSVFSLTLFFTFVAASVSNFLTTAYFMFFFQRNWSLLLFIFRSSSFLVIQVNVDIKNEWKDSFSVVFFSL